MKVSRRRRSESMSSECCSSALRLQSAKSLDSLDRSSTYSCSQRCWTSSGVRKNRAGYQTLSYHCSSSESTSCSWSLSNPTTASVYRSNSCASFQSTTDRHHQQQPMLARFLTCCLDGGQQHHHPTKAGRKWGTPVERPAVSPPYTRHRDSMTELTCSVSSYESSSVFTSSSVNDLHHGQHHQPTCGTLLAKVPNQRYNRNCAHLSYSL